MREKKTKKQTKRGRGQTLRVHWTLANIWMSSGESLGFWNDVGVRNVGWLDEMMPPGATGAAGSRSINALSSGAGVAMAPGNCTADSSTGTTDAAGRSVTPSSTGEPTHKQGKLGKTR